MQGASVRNGGVSVGASCTGGATCSNGSSTVKRHPTLPPRRRAILPPPWSDRGSCRSLNDVLPNCGGPLRARRSGADGRTCRGQSPAPMHKCPVTLKLFRQAPPPDIRQAAADLIADGRRLVRLLPSEKRPHSKAWQNAKLTAHEFGPDDNTGVQMGAKSGHLAGSRRRRARCPVSPLPLWPSAAV